MKIWIINNYNMLPQHGALCRSYYLGKYLKKLGQEPTVFVGSHPHNTNLQLIMDRSVYKVSDECDFPWVLVKTIKYNNSMIKRVFAMFQFYFNMLKTAKHFEKPDVIIGSSAHPLAAVAAIKLAHKYGCQSVAEIRDLWPESIVAFDMADRSNPLIKLLYQLEKWIYTKADRIIFTIEGGKDYIIEKGWDNEHGGPIELSKVYHINNGVDLETFDYDREHYTFADADLDNPNTINVVYTGSLRKANNIDLLLDAAKLVNNSKIRFLIYGKGDQIVRLQQRVLNEKIGNVILKGAIEKKYIPYVLSKSNIHILNYDSNAAKVLKYGGSQNKLFEYLASGKPVVSNNKISYSIIQKYSCGIECSTNSAEAYINAINAIVNMPREQRNMLCANARRAAQKYDFQVLTEKLINILGEQK